MGLEFKIEHANLVGWLTRRDEPSLSGHGDPFWDDYFQWRRWQRRRPPFDRAGGEVWKAPRATRSLLAEFLRSLPDALLTNDEEMRGSLRETVGMCAERLAAAQDDGRLVDEREPQPPSVVAKVLAPLRDWFWTPFYFLLLGGESPSRDALARSPDWTLWLRCLGAASGPKDDILDPFPAMEEALAWDRERPATLCWNWAGDVVLVDGHSEVLSAVAQIPPELLWPELKQRGRPRQRAFSILQLSDLHFGTPRARATLGYVEQHLHGVIEAARKNGDELQPVITGDLIDSPNEVALAEFEGFRNRLTRAANTRIVIIPGNHDMKRSGFLWRRLEEVAELEWNHVVESDRCKAIFLCFDSAKAAKLARGKITDKQFREVATRLGEVESLHDTSDRLRIALVHHHPFSSREDERDTLPFIGIKEEPFLRMENGDKLVEWCAKMKTPLILHGHKHQPRYVGQEVVLSDQGEARMVRAIGCGTTLGAENKPFSYNRITWRPEQRAWTVSFFADPGDGSGFVEKRIATGSG